MTEFVLFVKGLGARVKGHSAEHRSDVPDFDHFVTGLGRHAAHYTREELEQLYAEVGKLARLLLDTHRAKVKPSRESSPQSQLDGGTDDRTIESVLTEPVEGNDPPQALDE